MARVENKLPIYMHCLGKHACNSVCVIFSGQCMAKWSCCEVNDLQTSSAGMLTTEGSTVKFVLFANSNAISISLDQYSHLYSL